jgi:hypothetical protein
MILKPMIDEILTENKTEPITFYDHIEQLPGERWHEEAAEEDRIKDPSEEVNFNSAQMEHYLLDSGATCHVTNDMSLLKNMKHDETKIVVGRIQHVIHTCLEHSYWQ